MNKVSLSERLLAMSREAGKASPGSKEGLKAARDMVELAKELI